jgi:hypothetical protein
VVCQGVLGGCAWDQAAPVTMTTAAANRPASCSPSSARLRTAAHPGFTRTNLQTAGASLGRDKPRRSLLNSLNILPSQEVGPGTEPFLYAATSPGAVNGGYYGPGGRFGLVGPTTTVRPPAEPATPPPPPGSGPKPSASPASPCPARPLTPSRWVPVSAAISSRSGDLCTTIGPHCRYGLVPDSGRMAGRGVRVHAVLTGPTDTARNRGLDIPKASPESVARAITPAEHGALDQQPRRNRPVRHADGV